MRVSSPPPALGRISFQAPAARVTGTAASAPDLASELREFNAELEQWASANARDARHDTVRFWVFKLPAMLSSAASGLLSLEHLEVVATVLAAVATVCVLIDAVNPGGQLRNAHTRAVHDLRDLEHFVLNEWRIGRLKGREPGPLAAEILEEATERRERIALDLRTAETSFARNEKQG